MSLQIFVVAPSARQIAIKTRPEIYLNDILHEACQKLRLDPNQHGLKNNNRDLDLSYPIRHSGLSAGAKLQLTLLSKSPSIVNVALQLPESELFESAGPRLTEKFSSDTTLWMVLRKFESAPNRQAGGIKNFTGRHISSQNAKEKGTKELYYELPVLQNQGRTWKSFTDLQKTLAQLGFTKGNVLLKLTFQATETPFAEATLHIKQYFKIDAEVNDTVVSPDDTDIISSKSKNSSNAGSISQYSISLSHSESSPIATTENSPVQLATTNSAMRPTAVFSPPTSNTPQATRLAHNPQDFVPTVEHAKVHQALLSKTGQNQRLLSDAELMARLSRENDKLATTEKVEVKIRFPDQSQVVASFTKTDTANDLYEYVRSLLLHENEKFGLRYTSVKGTLTLKNDSQRLISDIGMINRILVSVFWDDQVSITTRKEQSLKAEIAAQGKELEVYIPQNSDTDGYQNTVIMPTDIGADNKPKRHGLPKWLKLPGKD